MKNLPLDLMQINDPELLCMLKRNDSNAFEILYKKYRQPLLNFADQYLKDKPASEDIVHELFTQLYIKDHNATIRSLSSYLYIAVKNKVLNHLRKRSIYKKHISNYGHNLTTSIANCVEQRFDTNDLEKKIGSIVNEMPEKYQQVYTLKYKHELSVKKVSFILKRPVSTIEKQSKKLSVFLKNNLKASAN
jgi:RNA polymerase sigma-70 factor (ECF subfamily)